MLCKLAEHLLISLIKHILNVDYRHATTIQLHPKCIIFTTIGSFRNEERSINWQQQPHMKARRRRRCLIRWSTTHRRWWTASNYRPLLHHRHHGHHLRAVTTTPGAYQVSASRSRPWSLASSPPALSCTALVLHLLCMQQSSWKPDTGRMNPGKKKHCDHTVV